ncbi:tellurium resistance protein TerC [Acinetobacter bereziniae]|jgi:plasmid maintenance system antidote protein VapI|uniref:tellurium resistance protein TerC n=1 Tax=Acinetobacter bereziniae TaxID=106648 RepID=UPI0012505262|nr:tellurium resistance protein TerC [Acinetobacter bereziniae]
MTYTELQITLLEMDLSIKDLATLLGMHPNSITNYKSTGIIPMHLAITVALIAHLKKVDISPEIIINEVKIKSAKDVIANNQR